ncbi:tRNA t(6)A37-methylthiotransferase [hydrothermal vent metagenome]|uniref:tRNA (N(6)-L-threonylcarbamoyladenosine(37)-C(2))-methylthiotransferase n=1 Tax=hydrothermal vent metagenome TaxID=652676 RepID=A0A3B1BFR7_9ZZZZ
MQNKQMTKRNKISFETLGCRYNRLESAEMAYELEQAGYAKAKEGEASDVVVINSCTVTDRSDAKCRSTIRRVKAKNPEAIVVVTGCYSETNPDEVSKEPGVDIVVGNSGKFEIGKLLSKLETDTNPAPQIASADKKLKVRPVTGMDGRTNAYIKVQAGCDEVCSFCIVRIARGKSSSAEGSDVVEQVKRLHESGIKEVVLSGINLGEYGDGKNKDIAWLLRKLCDETEIARIRLSSINPNNVTDELINLMAGSSRICRHLHIPLQSGSDSVLKRMRRPYTAKEYENLLNRLVDKIPAIGLGADVMVGFPGETEKEFNETFEIINNVPLMALHVFGYSLREGTEAFAMKGVIPKAIKKERSAKLKNLAQEKGEEFRKRFVGATLPVLIENTRDNDGHLKGFSDNYLQVVLDGPDSLINKIVQVKITGSEKERLTGSPQ